MSQWNVKVTLGRILKLIEISVVWRAVFSVWRNPSFVYQVILERNSFQLLNRGSICVDDLLVILMDPRKSVIQGDQLLWWKTESKNAWKLSDEISLKQTYLDSQISPVQDRCFSASFFWFYLSSLRTELYYTFTS